MARQISKVSKQSNAKGIEYNWSVAVTSSAEYGSYFKYRGDNISGLQDTYPSDTIICFSCTADSAGCNKWIITYNGVNSLDDFNISIVPQKINKSYSLSQFRFTPKMFGAHWAQASEILLAYGGTAATGNSKKNIDGADAFFGSLIYDNASGTSQGSADTSTSPIDLTTLPSTIDIYNLVANPYPTVVFKVDFPDNRVSTDDFFNWCGINGTFGTSATSPSSTTPKLWLAKQASSQTVKSGLNTTQYVTRVMETAPRYGSTQFYWSSSIYPTWVW